MADSIDVVPIGAYYGKAGTNDSSSAISSLDRPSAEFAVSFMFFAHASGKAFWCIWGLLAGGL